MPVSLFFELKDSDNQLGEFAKTQGIEFVSALDLLCKNQDCLAITMTEKGPRLTSFDYGHLTKAGSETLARALTATR